MWVVFLLLLPLVFSVTPALAESGFSGKYQRDYNIFNPASRYAPDNPLGKNMGSLLDIAPRRKKKGTG